NAYLGGQQQSVQFQVEGGSGSYTFSLGDSILNNQPNSGPNQFALIYSTLPAGLTFTNGVLSGTPHQSGVFPLAVQASNAGGVAFSEIYSLTIEAPTDAPKTIFLSTGNANPASLNPGTVESPYTATI